ncbi:MAG: hypothetical protein ACREJC_19685, partial [Tepidisphaeraceae bacterium]
GTTGEMRAQIRTASVSGVPSETVVDQARVLESALPSNYAWQTANFTSAGGLSTSSGMAVVFRWVADSEASDVQASTLAVSLSGAKFVQTANGGTSWSVNGLKALPIYVYGTTSTQDADTYQYNLASVRVSLRAGPDSAGGVNGAVQILNQPSVSGP